MYQKVLCPFNILIWFRVEVMLSWVNFNALWNSLCFLEKTGKRSVCCCPKNLFYGFGPRHASSRKQHKSKAKAFLLGSKSSGNTLDFQSSCLNKRTKYFVLMRASLFLLGKTEVWQAHPRNGQSSRIFFRVKYTDEEHVVSWNHMRFNEIRSRHYIFNRDSQVGQVFNSLAVVVLWKQLLLPCHFSPLETSAW